MRGAGPRKSLCPDSPGKKQCMVATEQGGGNLALCSPDLLCLSHVPAVLT